MKENMKNKKFPYVKLYVRVVLYGITLGLAVLSMISIRQDNMFPSVLKNSVYAMTGITFFISAFYIALEIPKLKKIIRKMVQTYEWMWRIVSDMEYRIMIFAAASFFFNVIFAGFNGVIGWLSHSPWFGTLAAYYILLGAMRYDWLRQNNPQITERRKEKRVTSQKQICILYGVLFIFMAVVLGGAVILLVHLEGDKEYPGVVIYAVAAYAFYKIIVSAMNMIKARKRRALSMIIIRDIGYIDACVSILTLQTALLSAFSIHQEKFTKMMNGMTGGAVSLMILILGLYYIRKAKE